MKKRLVAAMVALALSLMSTACAPTQSPPDDSSSTTQSTTTTTTKPLSAAETALLQDIQSYLGAKPVIQELPDYNPDSHPKDDERNDWANIRAITYDGAVVSGNKTKVFAYVGIPEGASASNKVPAVVLVHGGGGHPFAEWIKIWNDKGYAAIALDTTGYYPSQIGKGVAGYESHSSLWRHGLYGDFIQEGYVDTPDRDDMSGHTKPHQEQWIYHAVVNTIIAHNVLAEDERVDAEKIGITGISWGGVIASLAIGFDTRYAFAIPVYGSAYLEEAYSYFGDILSLENNALLWAATKRLDQITFPVLWMGWPADLHFSINSNSKSYVDTKSTGSLLSMILDWNHGHSIAWNRAEVYRFADSVVKGGEGMVTCVTEPSGREISFKINKPSDAVLVTARAIYITDPLSYSLKGNDNRPSIDQTWESMDCTVSGDTVTATLPSTAAGYYVELCTHTLNGNFITSTRFVEGLQ